MTCPIHPEKVRKVSIVDALDELGRRLSQPGSHVRRTYKCEGCHGWHFTSKRRPNFVSDPFPRTFVYGIERDGRRVYQCDTQEGAEGLARYWGKGHTVVPFQESAHRAHERSKHLARTGYGR